MAVSETERERDGAGRDAGDAGGSGGRPRASVFLDLARSHLKAYPLHELLAAAGIAIGVALAFAVLVANSSIGRSSEEIVRGVTGTADLQVQARTGDGIDATALLAVIRRTPGVTRAAALLEQRAVLAGPGGVATNVNLVAVDADLAALSGRLTRSFVRGALSLSRGIVLPASTAALIGIEDADTDVAPARLPTIRVELRGRAASVPVAAVFGRDMLGPVTDARAAVMSVAQLRQIAGLPDRVSRILVETDAGAEASVRRQLTLLARGRLTVTDVGSEPRLLREALRPTAQATSFFALVAALLGFLLAFNAVLLTAPQRRRWLADLITVNGASPRTVVVLVVLQSLALGVVGCAAGLLLGLVLANGILHESPDYLAPAFTLGSRTVISAMPVLVSCAGGLLACLLAAAPLLMDVRPGRSLETIYNTDEEPGNALQRHTTVRMLAAAALLVACVAAVLLLLPSAALVACGLLALATVLTVPATFVTVVAAAAAIERRAKRRLVMLSSAVRELRATTLRSLALASTGAVAVFGSVAIGGARQDLLRGIERYTHDYVSTADLWIAHAGDNQATNAFPLEAAQLRRLAGVAGVDAVRTYHGGFLDLGDRRVWVIARDPADRAIAPRSQMHEGDAARADAQVRSGGWATVSDQLARATGAGLGETITLPTPTGPRRLRVAAITTNLGWSPGAVIMNARDFRSWWGTSDPTALQVDLRPGASPTTVARALGAALGPESGLHVQTAQQRGEEINRSARSGLSRLGQISTLLLISACLAMAAALGAAIWQRRPRLSQAALVGVLPAQLWRALLIESGLVLGAGCLTGAAFGILGEVVIDRYLVDVTGYPVDVAIATWPALATFGLVLGSALSVVAIPGWFAARVSPELSFED